MSATDKMSRALWDLVTALRQGNRVIQMPDARPASQFLDLSGIVVSPLHGTYDLFLPLPEDPSPELFHTVAGYMVGWTTKDNKHEGWLATASFLPILPTSLDASSPADVLSPAGTGRLPSGVLPRPATEARTRYQRAPSSQKP